MKRDAVQYVVVESSYIDLKDGELNFKVENDIELKESPSSIEKKLQSWAYDNFVSVQVRKAFKPKVFSRLFMIWTANDFNHDIWFRSNTLVQLFSGFSKGYGVDELEKYSPLVFRTDGALDREVSVRDPKFSQVVDVILKYKKKVIFYNPPLSKNASSKDCLESRQQMYKRVTQIIDTVFLDYSCGDFPASFLRDPTHLNPDGRIYFSQILAKDIFEKVLKEVH